MFIRRLAAAERHSKSTLKTCGPLQANYPPLMICIIQSRVRYMLHVTPPAPLSCDRLIDGDRRLLKASNLNGIVIKIVTMAVAHAHGGQWCPS